MIKEDIPKKLLMNLSSDNDQPTGKTYHHLLGYIIKNTSKKEVNHFFMKIPEIPKKKLDASKILKSQR